MSSNLEMKIMQTKTAIRKKEKHTAAKLKEVTEGVKVTVDKAIRPGRLESEGEVIGSAFRKIVDIISIAFRKMAGIINEFKTGFRKGMNYGRQLKQQTQEAFMQK